MLSPTVREWRSQWISTVIVLVSVFAILQPTSHTAVLAADPNCTYLTSIANCTNYSSCEWQVDASRCVFKSSSNATNCSTITYNVTCVSSGCNWTVPTAVQGYYCQTRNTAPTPAPTVACASIDIKQTCQATGGCEWTNVNATSGRWCAVKGSSATTLAPTPAPLYCDSYTNATICNAIAGCSWSAARAMCVSSPNATTTAAPQVTTLAPQIPNATSAPSSGLVNCSTITYNLTCVNSGCNWTNPAAIDGYYCQTRNTAPTPAPTVACASIDNKQNCQLTGGCEWTNSTATSGRWCAVKGSSATTLAPTPAPLYCDSYTNATICNAIAGCSWSAARAMCASSSNATTTAAPQVTTLAPQIPNATSAPSSGPVNCSTITYNLTCVNSGCNWTNPAAFDGFFCRIRNTAPTPAPTVACASIDNKQNCQLTGGCEWTNSTATSGRWCAVKGSSATTLAPTPAPLYCDSYTNATICNAIPGCSWKANNAICVNSPTASPQGTTLAPQIPNVTAAPSCSGITAAPLCLAAPDCEWQITVTGSYCRRKEGCAALNASACRVAPACGWDASTSSCKPVTNATNAPPPLSCEALSVAECQLNQQCGLTNFTTATGAIVSKCMLRACATYDARSCPARCAADAQTGRCLPPACWNYTNADTCRNNTFGACYWLANANRSGCFPVGCDTIRYDQRACDYSPRCRWSALEQRCNALSCAAATCFGEFCEWASEVPTSGTPGAAASGTAGSVAVVCVEKLCGSYGAYTCPPERCVLNDQLQCANAPCQALSTDRCTARIDCTWVASATGSSATGGTCAPKTCPMHTSLVNCYAANCYWNSAQGVCAFMPCNYFSPPNFTRSQCEAYPVCRPNAPSDVVGAPQCIPRECSARSVDACTGPCQWNREAGRCAAVPCLNYTKSSCPSFECAWAESSGLCVAAACKWAATSAACAQVPGCAWLDALGECFDVGFAAAVPCNLAPSSALCSSVPQPQGRCSWISLAGSGSSSNSSNGNATSGASSASGYCAPTTTLVECYEVAVGTKCPSYCVNVYGYCLNPICAKLTTNVTCRQGKCQWNGTVCNDPRASVLPCVAYSGAACPGRCWTNGTICLDTKPGAGSGSGGSGAPTSCREIGDIAVCTKQTGCWFNQSSGACQERPCSLYTGADACPADRCRFFASTCQAPCPASLPVFCTQLGTCAASTSLCVGCSSSQAQCWDGSCKASLSACPCPPERSVKCGNGNCVSNQSRCDLECPQGTVRCWNNECAPTSDQCPCPVTKPNQCNVSGRLICVTDLASCDDACPSLTPFKCWDGSCARNNVSCACNPQSVRCETDYNCYPSLLQCPCRPVVSTSGNQTVMPMRCSDLKCRLNCSAPPETVAPTTAAPTNACSGKTSYQCPDRSCAENVYACPRTCSGAGGEMPSIVILATGGTFLTTEWFRLQANLSYVVCGVQRAATLSVSWSAFAPASGAAVALGKSSQASGTSLAVAPNTFVAGMTYAFVVVAKIPGLEFSASALVTLTAVAPVPVLTFIGGDRVSPAGALSLGVNVLDKTATDSDSKSFFWVCAKDGGLSTCSEGVAAALASATTNYVALTSVPAGNYTFTCFYKGLNASASVTVLPGAVPVVQIIQQVARFYAGQPARLYAIAKHSLPVTLTWMVNGVVLSGQTSSVVVVPGSYLRANGAAKVTVVATDANGATGRSTLVVTAEAAVTGWCALSIASGGLPDGTASALSTVLRADASFNATDGLEYRFSYVDFDAAGQELDVVLSSFWGTLPYLEFTAPVLRANQDRNATIVARARRQGGTEVWAARCSAMVRAATTATVASTAQNTAALLAEAVSANDTTTAVTAAQTASRALAAGVSDASVVKSVAQSVVDGLSSATQRTSASLSSSDRGAAVQAVQSALIASDANATQAREFISQNAAKIVDMVRSVLKATGDAALDPATAGNATLDLVSRTLSGAGGSAVAGAADAVTDLAKLTAQSAQLGQRTTLVTSEVKVQGEARSASDVGGRGFGGDNSSCTFPQNFGLAGRNETSVVQVGSAQYTRNPVGETGKPAGTQLATAVAEFHVQVDGQDQPIVNQNPPLQLSFQVSAAVNATANTTFHCRYFDNATQSWVSTGVVFDRYDAATRKVWCNTTHLSTFGAFSDNSAVTSAPSSPATPSPASPVGTPSPLSPAGTPSPASPVGTPSPANPVGTPSPPSPGEVVATGAPSVPLQPQAAAPASDSTATTGAIIGGCVGGVVLIAVITLVIIKSRGGSQAEDEYGQPMNELRVPSPQGDRAYAPPSNAHNSYPPRVANDEDVL